MIKVSVVILTKNCREEILFTLEKCGSVLKDAHQVVFKDGESSDGTLSVIEQFQHSNVLVRSTPDDGISDGWNQAIDECTGDWILFLNAGDYLDKNFLKRLPSQVESRIQVLFGEVVIFSRACGQPRIISGRLPRLSSIRKGSVGFGHPGSLYRSNLFFESGLRFDKGLKIAMDFKKIVQIFIAHPGGFERHGQITYMDGSGVSTRNLKLGIKECFNILQELGLIGSVRRVFGFYLMFFARKLWRIKFAREFAVSIKHALIFILVLAEKFIILNAARKIFFRICGFKLADRATICHQFNFYRLGNVEVGEGTVINRNCDFDNRNRIVIGANCSISRGVSIFTGGHRVNSVWLEYYDRPVFIGDKVVIFSNATILPGAVIEEGVVVYPGSVVRGRIPAYSIVDGCPGQIIGERRPGLLYSIDYPFVLAK